MELTLIIRQGTSDTLNCPKYYTRLMPKEHTTKKIKIPFICDVMPCLVETPNLTLKMIQSNDLSLIAFFRN
jgi:hypothetical protein